MTLNSIEWFIGRAGAVAMLFPLGAVLFGLWRGLWRGLRRPQGPVTGHAIRILRAPLFYIVATVGYFGLCFLIWQPLPLELSPPARIVALCLGTLFYFPGLALVLWGRLTLGKMYFVSSSFGAFLYADHQLITEGPFAIVRHPMYLGLLMAGVGGLLIYRTWTLVFLLGTCLAVMVRARLEEKALAEQFGKQWDDYCLQVPAWFPRIQRKSI